jgi:preprotein translocase subunit SecY
MGSAFESVFTSIIVVTLALFSLFFFLSSNAKENEIAKRCEMQGSFIIGETVYICKKSDNHIARRIEEVKEKQ